MVVVVGEDKDTLVDRGEKLLLLFLRIKDDDLRKSEGVEEEAKMGLTM